MPIKEEVKKNEIVKKEPVPVIEKPIMVQKKDMDKNKIYIGLGISTIDEPDLGKDLDSVKFNYSFAYLKKESDYMYGGIYHISAYRVYGSLANGTNPQTYTAYELQSNINILGATVRKYLGSTDGSSPYVRVDGGLAWQTMGKSVVLMPLEDSNGMSLGGNIGAGISIKTGFGSINIDVYHTIYSPPESAKIDSGMTNFTLGMMF